MLGNGLGGSELRLLLHVVTQVRFPGPASDDWQSPVIPALGELTPSLGLHRHLHSMLTPVGCFSLSLEARWRKGEGDWVTMSFPGGRLWWWFRSGLMCMFTAIYPYITQSAKDILCYSPVTPNGMQCLCHVRMYRGQYVQAVCLQAKGRKQVMPWTLVPD